MQNRSFILLSYSDELAEAVIKQQRERDLDSVESEEGEYAKFQRADNGYILREDLDEPNSSESVANQQTQHHAKRFNIDLASQLAEKLSHACVNQRAEQHSENVAAGRAGKHCDTALEIREYRHANCAEKYPNRDSGEAALSSQQRYRRENCECL